MKWNNCCMVVSATVVALVFNGCCWFGDSFESILSKAKSRQYEMLQEYVRAKRFGQPIPKLEGAQLDGLCGDCLTTEQRRKVVAAVDAEYNRGKRELVFSKWVDYRVSDIGNRITALVAKGRENAATNGFELARGCFEEAREAGWQGSVLNVDLGGSIVPEVYEPVHKAAVDLIDEKVGVAEWPVVEYEMNLIVSNAVAAADLESGIEKLKNYRHIRAYTKVLDGKVAALVKELQRLGVTTQATDRIVQKTQEWMRQYENLSDLSDKSITEKKTIGGGAKGVDESIYKRLLKEYEEALLTYDCTNANTKKIIDALAKAIAASVDCLPKPPPAVEVESLRLVRLGATALNARIDKLRQVNIGHLNASLEESRLRGKEINDLLKGDPSAAFAKVGRILLGVEKANEIVRSLAMKKLLTEINPAIWEARSKEMWRQVDKFVKENKCIEGVAWFSSYNPYVRTYAEEIDSAYAAIVKSAIETGIPDARVREIMDEAAKTAAELAYLADYTDKLVDEVTPGTKIPADKIAAFEKAVDDCHASLVRNGCIESNAVKVVAAIRARFATERALLEADIHKDVLYLGSNALNLRLRNLKTDCVGALIGRCTSALIQQNRFDEARSAIRGIALSGDADFDEKVYAMRIGVLSTVVNPVQCEKRKAEITSYIDGCWKKGDYRAIRDWMGKYPYVHDSYPDLTKAAKAMQTAMENLKIDEPDPERYVEKILSSVRGKIEAASSGYRLEKPTPDLGELERAVGLFEKAYIAQYYNKDEVAAVCDGIRADILLFLDKPTVAMTTAEVNAVLKAHMEDEVRRHIVADAESRKPRYKLADDPVQAELVKNAVLDAAKKGLVAFTAGKDKDAVYAEMAGAVELPALEWLRNLWNELNEPREVPSVAEAEGLPFGELVDMLVQRQEYLEFLADMDKEVVYDSQIAMAEDAIAKQLCATNAVSLLQSNAMLGEYARTMRLLKQAKTLNKDQGAAMVFGAIYLDQPAVFVRALELGADVNSVSARDPLKRNALLLAIQLGRTSFVHRLVDRGARLSAIDSNGDTAIHYAVRRGNLAVLKAMVAKVDVNVANGGGETALFDAARMNEPAVVQVLLDAKANVRKANIAGFTAFDAACESGSRDVLEALASADAVFGPQQLIIAARNNRLSVAQWLVSKGVDVNAPGVVEASERAPAVRAFLLRQGGVVPVASAENMRK